MGHIGWTPQSQHGLGGKVKVQGKSRDDARAMLSDAIAIQQAGAFSHRARARPGAARRGHHLAPPHPDDRHRRRPHCSGQVQVIPDLLGLGDFKPKHAAPTRTSRARSPRDARVDGRRRRRHVPGPAETVRMDDACSTRPSVATRTTRSRGPHAAGMIPLDRDL
jgi:hypothetical protein